MVTRFLFSWNRRCPSTMDHPQGCSTTNVTLCSSSKQPGQHHSRRGLTTCSNHSGYERQKAQMMLVLLSLIFLSGKGESEQTLVSLSEIRDGLLRKHSTITSLKEFGTSPLQQCHLPSAPKLDWQIPPGIFLPGRLSTPSINPESHVLDINWRLIVNAIGRPAHQSYLHNRKQPVSVHHYVIQCHIIRDMRKISIGREIEKNRTSSLNK